MTQRGEAYGETYGLFPNRHVLTDAGQVFFETNEALVPSDTNGQLDVYEYEGGGAHLISSGTSSFESVLEDASESGDDAFFSSAQAARAAGQPGRTDRHLRCARRRRASPNRPPRRRARPPTPAACRFRHSLRSTGRRRARHSPASATSRRLPLTVVQEKVYKKKTVKCKQGPCEEQEG